MNNLLLHLIRKEILQPQGYKDCITLSNVLEQLRNLNMILEYCHNILKVNNFVVATKGD